MKHKEASRPRRTTKTPTYHDAINRNLEKSNQLKQIQKLRTQIDDLDSNIISLISKRIALAQKIQTIKKQHHITKIDPKREINIIQRLQKQHPTLKKLITNIYPHIFSHTRGENKKKSMILTFFSS